MTKGNFLGELEHVVLLALARTGGKAFGVAIQAEIERTTRRDVSVPAVYVTLARMERKGWVRCRDVEGTTERGGRARKRFELTASGRQAMARTRAVLEQLWNMDGLESEGR